METGLWIAYHEDPIDFPNESSSHFWVIEQVIFGFVIAEAIRLRKSRLTVAGLRLTVSRLAISRLPISRLTIPRLAKSRLRLPVPRLAIPRLSIPCLWSVARLWIRRISRLRLPTIILLIRV